LREPNQNSMRNRKIQQQYLSAFGVVVVATESTKYICVCVNSSGVIAEAVTFLKIVPSCYCCLVNSVPRQNPGRLRSGASSVTGLLNGLSPVTSTCLYNLLWNEILCSIFSRRCYRAPCKTKQFALLAREEALPVQAPQEALGCVRSMAQHSPGPRVSGCEYSPDSWEVLRIQCITFRCCWRPVFTSDLKQHK